jgi:hypothetical protein
LPPINMHKKKSVQAWAPSTFRLRSALSPLSQYSLTLNIWRHFYSIYFHNLNVTEIWVCNCDIFNCLGGFICVTPKIKYLKKLAYFL